MEHIENHPHALIKENIVVIVCMFEDHLPDLIESRIAENNADQAICCCDLGMFPSVGWTWDGLKFNQPEENYVIQS